MSKSKSKSGHHEALADQHRIKGGSNRGFGLTVGGVLLAIAAYRFFTLEVLELLSSVLLALGGALVAFGLLLPDLLAPLNRAWIKLGLLLSRIANPVIMAFLFLTTVVPIGLVMRLAGKDLLQLKFDPKAESYWIEREPPGPAPETIKNQF